MSSNYSEESDDPYAQALRELFDRVEKSLRELGLYVDAVQASRIEGQDKLVVVTTATIGDRAWMPAVQDPDTHAINEAARPMLDEFEESEIERLTRKAKERNGGNDDPAGD
jgi:CHASE3 domain sensor protein